MQDFPPFAWVFLIPIVAIAGGIMVAIVSTITKGRVRELEIRERIAMIERGMIPPPEADPAGFERSLRSVEGIHYRQSGARHRSAGIIVMSIGFGLMLLISFSSGAVGAGIGVGGFLVILGLGLFVVSLFSTPTMAPPPVGLDRRPPPGPGNGPTGPAELH
jgi:Flp pilus assembly protein TadB